MVKKALIYINHFYPGVNSGGQARTIHNLINLIDNRITLKIVTRNNDFKSKKKYSLPCNIELNYKSKAKIFYSDDNFKFKTMKDLEKGFSNIIHCGFFEPFTYKNLIKLIFYKAIKKFIILPMGVFSLGAIRYKTLKKIIYIFLFNFFCLSKKVTFAFSSNQELNDAIRFLHKIPNYFILTDIPSINRIFKFKYNKVPKLIFLSRINPIKNLDFAIKVINGIDKKVQFDIYGPKEDLSYWNLCENELNSSDKIIKWKYCGVVKSNVGKVFSNYDIFVFPTRGENFGHVIFESMANGCIPIISNLTPWTEFLKNRLDFSCNLNDINCFIQKVNFLLNDFDNIKKYKLKFQKEAIIFYKKNYGISYFNNLNGNLL